MDARSYARLPFDAEARLAGTALDDLVAAVEKDGIENLFVFSHGWGNTVENAENLYAGMFPLIAAAAAGRVDDVGFAGVFWPSIWFPDPPTHDAPEVAAAVADGRPGAANAALTGAQLAGAIATSLPASAHADLTTLGALVDRGLADAGKVPDAEQQANVEKFHSLLQELMPATGAAREDAGERSALLSANPTDDYQRLADATGSALNAGDAQGILDPFKKAWNGAKDVLRTFSFYEMKGRAGDIGQHGLAPVLVGLHQQVPGLRVHLLGHSFGARLVAYSLKGIPSAAASPVASLTLIQGAFSHWAFAPAGTIPGEKKAGGLLGCGDRVHGPLVATFSSRDWAVGQWYPRASFLAQDSSQAEQDAIEKWSGMGADGFQGSRPFKDAAIAAGAAMPGPLAAGTFYRVDANAVIKDTSASSFSGAHSDIQHAEVASMVVAAATPAP